MENEKQTPERYSYAFDRHTVEPRYDGWHLSEEQIAYGSYLCRKHTGYDNLEEMAKNYPTIRPEDARGKSRKELYHLRELYAIVTGRPAFGLGGLPCSVKEMLETH